MSLRAGVIIGLAILGIVLLGVWLIAPSALAEMREWFEPERLETLVARGGLWGPVLIVTLMTIAVVASPIPSAPIALAAGAAYGHVWGTVQVVIGAELGALIAFGLARVLGDDALRRVFGTSVDAGLLGSQTALTATVFASRLMPFVSFNMISYAAGLSRLHAWRFAPARLAGIFPASFLLAHFGGERWPWPGHMGGPRSRPRDRAAADLDGDAGQGGKEAVMAQRYQKNSLPLFDTVTMGTGVMIGAGILALTGRSPNLRVPCSSWLSSLAPW